MIGCSSAMTSSGAIGPRLASSGIMCPSLRMSGGIIDERCRSDDFESTINRNSASMALPPPVGTEVATGRVTGGTPTATGAPVGAAATLAGSAMAERSGTKLTASSAPLRSTVTLNAPASTET